MPLTVQPLAAAVSSGATTAGQVVDELLDRIAARGDDGVWIDRLPPRRLRARAAELDALVAADPGAAARLPLLGVPFAVKGNLDVAGLPTTAGCPAFAHHPAEDAEAVGRLLAAGAVLVGTTTLDQFATGLVGTRSPYGVPRNALVPDLVPGGSSSGSAVAVAAGLVPFALGTDTAGSGRVPAALNGIVGLKPTRGLVSTRGVVPACRSLDCVSVFTRTVGDAAAVLAVLAGPDPRDPWSRTAPAAPAPPSTVPDLARLVVAMPAEADLDFSGDDAMRRAHLRLRASVAARCARVVTVPLAPLLEAGSLLYTGPWVAERLAALAGVLADHPDGVLPVTRAILEGGARFTAVDAFRARHRLAELAAQVRAWWDGADVLLLPTVATTFTVAEVAAEPFAHNATLGRYTQSTNLLDLAGLALPAGTTDDGRPHGVALYGPAFSDRRLLEAGALLLGEAPPPRGERPVDGAVTVAVAGRHLSGESRNGELVALGARLVETARTAPDYRLLALPPDDDPLPALVRARAVEAVEAGGAVEVELWAVPRDRLADLLDAVPAPLALGRVTLADGRQVAGFVGEARAAQDPRAVDLTGAGGWRYRSGPARPSPDRRPPALVPHVPARASTDPQEEE